MQPGPQRGKESTIDSVSAVTQGTVLVPYIVAQPISSWSAPGAIPAFTVDAGGFDLKYQWYAGAQGDDSHPIAGANASVYQPLDYGRYWVRVSNVFGLVNSAEASSFAAVPVRGVDAATWAQWPSSGDPQAVLAATGSRVDLVSSAPGSNVTARSPLVGMPFDEDWSVQAEIELASGLPASSFSNLHAGFFLYGSTPNFAFTDLHGLGFRLREGNPKIEVWEWYRRNEDTSVLAPDLSFVPPTGSRVTLRIDYSALSGYLTYYVDRDGSAGPAGWAFHSSHQLQDCHLLGSPVRKSGLLLCLEASSAVSNAGDVCRITDLTWRCGTAQLSAPVISVQPKDVMAARQGSAQFFVGASGDGLRYQWFKGARGDVSHPVRSSVDVGRETLTIDPVLTGGQYWVLAFNQAGSASSEAATLSLDATKYAGIYFGMPGGGAMYVGPNNRGGYFGWVSSTEWEDLITDGSVTVSDTANILVSYSTRQTLHPPPGWSVTSVFFEPPYTYSGTLDSDGGGMLQNFFYGRDPLGDPFPITRSAISGPWENQAGYYLLDYGSCRCQLVLSATGDLYVHAEGYRSAGRGQFVVDGAGAFSGVLSDGSFITGRIAPRGELTTIRITKGSDAFQASGKLSSAALISRLSNLSINTQISVDEGVTAGFIVKGSGRKPLLVRGVGPALGELGVLGDNWQRDVAVTLHRIQDKVVLGSNSGWGSFASNPKVFQANNAYTGFQFLSDSADSALVDELSESAGGYTVQLKTSQSTLRTAMAELYELDGDSSSRLTNISALTRVSPDKKVTVGFVVSGNAPKRLLIRGVGPSLAEYGIPTGYLPDPKLDIFEISEGAVFLIARNDNWVPSLVEEATLKSGAGLKLVNGSNDAAIDVTLLPGAYTIEMSSADGQEGQGLIEVYEAD